MSTAKLLQSSVVYFEGEFVPFEKATVSIASAPVQYGLSVYTAFNVFVSDEGIRAFRLRDHYDRLVNSSKIVGMVDFASVCSYPHFKQLVSELIERNGAQDKAIVRVNYYLNTDVTDGPVINGRSTELSMFVLPFNDYYHKSELSVMVSSWRRITDSAIPARAKITGSYVNSALMKSEAVANGFDDCVALDEHGHVAESAVANIFLVKNGKLITPGASTDILEGVTRDTIIKLAEHMGLSVEERSVDRTELYTADEIFLSGSSVRIWPITFVDRRQIGNGTAGTITKRIAEEYATLQQGGGSIHPEWIVSLKSKGRVYA